MYTWKYSIYVPWTYRIFLQGLFINIPTKVILVLRFLFQWDVVLKWKMSVVPPDGTSQKNRYGREMKTMILYQQIISMNFVFACSTWIKTIGFRSKCMTLMTLKHFAPHDSNIDCVFSTWSQHDAPLGTLRLVRSTRHEASQHALLRVSGEPTSFKSKCTIQIIFKLTFGEQNFKLKHQLMKHIHSCMTLHNHIVYYVKGLSNRWRTRICHLSRFSITNKVPSLRYSKWPL